MDEDDGRGDSRNVLAYQVVEREISSHLRIDKLVERDIPDGSEEI